MSAALDSEGDLDWADGLIRSLFDAGRHVGLAAAFVVDGGLRHVVSMGFEDAATARPLSRSTVFGAGPVTKTLTAVAILQLAEDGRIDLDQPAAIGGHSVRDVLSGRDGGDGIDGYTGLERLIEHVTGEGYTSYVEKHIFAAVEMAHSTFAPAAGPGSATGHRVDAMTVEPAALTPGPISATGWWAPIDDMARWVEIILGGGANDCGRVTARETMAAALAGSWHDGDGASSRGLAFTISDLSGHRVAHQGGSAGGFSADLWVAPAVEAGVAVLSNRGGCSPGFAGRLMAELLERVG